jgi:hypothetical protein
MVYRGKQNGCAPTDWSGEIFCSSPARGVAVESGRVQLFQRQVAGRSDAFLGQDDRRLRYPPPNLITREEAYAYPTDFAAMSEDWIDRLSRRGEQLTKALIAEHAPDLGTLRTDN